MIDVNFLLGTWPFRWLPARNASDLAQAMARYGIQKAWVGGVEACFVRDLAAANQRLADGCRSVTSAELVPWGTVNPLAPDWRDDVRRCHELHQMPGVRLVPGCHGYSLSADEVGEFVAAATESKMVVQVVMEWEDVRTQHPVFRIPPVDPLPLNDLVRRHPRAKFVLLNAMRQITLDAARDLAALGNVYFDLSMLEGVDAIARLVESVGEHRVLFGSGYPLFYVESGLLKLRETTLPPSIVQRIIGNNPARVLEW